MGDAFGQWRLSILIWHGGGRRGAVKFMGQLYRKRWSIEVCFQNMKRRGFDLEDTHLQDDEKLKKLVALASIAYAFSASLGIYRAAAATTKK